MNKPYVKIKSGMNTEIKTKIKMKIFTRANESYPNDSKYDRLTYRLTVP